MHVPDSVKPRIKKKVSEMEGGECFIYLNSIMLKLQTHYIGNIADATRLSDGCQIKFLDEDPEFEIINVKAVVF